MSKKKNERKGKGKPSFMFGGYLKVQLGKLN